MKSSRHRVLAIARKEFLHIIHDPRSLTIIFLMPLFQLVMYGYALNLEIKRVELAVVDYSHSSASRHLVEEFSGNGFFSVFYYTGRFEELESLFLDREARVILIIDPDFAKNFQKHNVTSVQVLIDGSDPNAATLIRNYCNQVVQQFNDRYGVSIPVPFEVESTIWFNPDMKSAYFFVPGLLALLLIMVCALLTSITITREKEMGTMEQILVSPVRAHEIIIGKVLPYVLISLLIGLLIVALGVVLFHVPFRGSYLLLTLLSLLYIITSLSIGIMISTITQTQQVAMMLALVATLLPTLVLSGFIFPLASMPWPLQVLANIIPATFYLHIVRGIMLKGNTFMQLLQPTLVLLFMTVLMLLIAKRKFSLTLET